MGCCGEPVRKDDQCTNRPQQPPPTGVVQQQPTAQVPAQMYEKPALLMPTGPSPPPPSFHHNHPTIHGGLAAQQWGHGSPSPPPVSIHHGMSPQTNMSMQMIPHNPAYGPPGGSHVAIPTPLYQPSPVHAPARHASTSPTLTASIAHGVTSMPRNEFGGPPDEGRMSISIDFGTSSTRRVSAGSRMLTRVSLPRNYFFWRGE